MSQRDPNLDRLMERARGERIAALEAERDLLADTVDAFDRLLYVLPIRPPGTMGVAIQESRDALAELRRPLDQGTAA